MDLPPPVPPMAPPPRGGVHDASRIPEAEKEKMSQLYKSLGSIDAVVKSTGHTWKTVAMVCDPSRLHKGVSLEQISEVKALLHAGSGAAQAAKETGLSLRQVAAIIASDGELAKAAKTTRGVRAIAAETVAMESLLDTIEKRQASGKMTIAEGANALLVLNNMVKDAVGAVATKIEVDVNHKHEASSALMASLVHGGATIEIPKPPAPIIDVETVNPNSI